MNELVRAGLVKSSWNKGPNGGMLTHSLVVIGYRAGNPKSIKDWPDLARRHRRALPRSQDLRRRTLERQRDLRLRLARANSDPVAAPRPSGSGPGERRQHGPFRPAEHGQLRARHRRRDRHLRKRVAPQAQERSRDSLRRPARHSPDRKPRGRRQRIRREAQESRGRRGVQGFLDRPRRAADLDRLRLPAGRSQSCRRDRPPFADATFHHEGPRRLEEKPRRTLRAEGAWTTIFTDLREGRLRR